MTSTEPDPRQRLAAFLETLEALDPFEGVTLRGCTADAEFVRNGQSTVTQGVLSTSRNIKVATENESVPAIYAVLSRTGRSIAPFSSRRWENEVVFLPGTVFFLAETRRMVDLDVRLVFEVDVHDPAFSLPDETISEVADFVEQALAAHQQSRSPEVEVIPGKFAGDIA
jgi:hypothetical protein